MKLFLMGQKCALSVGVVMIFSVFQSTSAMAFDLTDGAQTGIYIESRKQQKDVYNRYTFCTDVRNPSTCRILGIRQWYNREHLNKLRYRYHAKNWGNGALTAVSAAGSLIAGFAIYASAGSMTTLLGGAVIGSAASAWNSGVDFVDVRHLLKTALSSAATQDQDMKLELTLKDWYELALHLESALNSLD
jgi:hypothetical protein